MPYNKGDLYEQTIFEILQNKKLIPENFLRAGAGGGADVKFVYKSQSYNLEVKADLNADYGQKMLRWNLDSKLWYWSVDNPVTQLYTSIGVLDYVNEKKFIPNRFTVPTDRITIQHKKQDQKAFEDRHDLDIRALYEFYSHKNCYYIQVGGYGFYHLQEDILNLNTTKFNCGIHLRLRAKTIHSVPIHNYGFYAVIKTNGEPELSAYDIEEKDNRSFPPIVI